MKALIAFFALLLATGNAAAYDVCTSKIDAVFIDAAGNVAAHAVTNRPSAFGGWISLCNIKVPSNTQVCSNWLSVAMQAAGEQPTTLLMQTIGSGCDGYPGVNHFTSVTILR